MKKLLTISVTLLVSLGALAWCLQDNAPSPRVLASHPDEKTDIGAPSGSNSEEAESKPYPRSLRGAHFREISPELAAHLDLDPEVGWMVNAVEDGSPAKAAGLISFDVLLAINGNPATTQTLAEASKRSGETEFTIIRAGLTHHIAIPTVGSRQNNTQTAEAGLFLASDQLPSDHPFRKLTAFAVLHESYATKVTDFSHRMRELESLSREAQEDARQEAKSLQKECETQVAARLKAWEDELLQRVDQQFDEKRVEVIAALKLDPKTLIPEKPVKGIANSIEQAKSLLCQTKSQNLSAATPLTERDLQTYRRRSNQIRNEASQLLSERVVNGWVSRIGEISQNETKLQKRHGERATSTKKKIKDIRGYLRKRVTCAFKRSRQEFNKKLARRLSKMEVPRPGEIAACLDDVRQQADMMTRRFFAQTETALAEFEDQVRRANERLTGTYGPEFTACETAFTNGHAQVEGVVMHHEAASIGPDLSKWQVKAELSKINDLFRTDLRHAINETRNATRKHSVELARAFGEHHIVCEDSWKDLQHQLYEICKRAASDCWKIDGPHLDGRFPKKKAPDYKLDIVDLTSAH